MASSSDEGRVTTPITDGLSSSTEGELAIDQDASIVSLASSPRAVPDLTVAVRTGADCIRDFLHHVSGNEGALSRQKLGGEAAHGDSFVEIMRTKVLSRRAGHLQRRWRVWNCKWKF